MYRTERIHISQRNINIFNKFELLKQLMWKVKLIYTLYY